MGAEFYYGGGGRCKTRLMELLNFWVNPWFNYVFLGVGMLMRFHGMLLGDRMGVWPLRKVILRFRAIQDRVGTVHLHVRLLEGEPEQRRTSTQSWKGYAWSCTAYRRSKFYFKFNYLHLLGQDKLLNSNLQSLQSY